MQEIPPVEEAVPQTQGEREGPKKCPDCKEYYGAEAYGGKCSVCYKRSTSSQPILVNPGPPVQQVEYYVPIRKMLCKAPGCSFGAREELEGFCQACYEEHYQTRR